MNSVPSTQALFRHFKDERKNIEPTQGYRLNKTGGADILLTDGQGQKKFIFSEEFHVYSSPVNSEPYQRLPQEVGGTNGKVFSGSWFWGVFDRLSNLGRSSPFQCLILT